MVYLKKSEFGHLRLPQGHDWLHVRLEEGWDDAIVESAILSRLKLHLVDVTILVTNGCWPVFITFGKTFDYGNHLGTHSIQ